MRPILWISVATSLALTGCTTTAPQSLQAPTVASSNGSVAASSSPTVIPTRWTSADYSTEMTSVADGARVADLIAVVVVRGARYVKGEDLIPMTYQSVVIEQVLGGRRPKPKDSEITVVQTGGLFDGEFIDNTSDPVLPVGYRVLLFLKNTSSDHYASIDGPYGRFEIDGQGKVTPFADKVGLGGSGMRFHGTLSELGAAVASAS